MSATTPEARERLRDQLAQRMIGPFAPARGHEGYSARGVRGDLCDGMVGSDAAALCEALNALPALLADSDALAAAERERDEAIRQARLSSLRYTPEWSEARSHQQLADLMTHMGYADGDSGYTLRYLSYAEMDIVRAALLATAPEREGADGNAR